MTCYIHPERESQWTCAACGKEVCPECKVTLQGETYCNPCAEQMYLAAVNRKEPSWTEKHLNLSLLIAFMVSEIAAFFIMLTLAPFTDAGYAADEIITPAWMISTSAAYVILFPVVSWVVRKKARSPWNVLWLLMPLGIIMILLLSNMSKQTANDANGPQIS